MWLASTVALDTWSMARCWQRKHFMWKYENYTQRTDVTQPGLAPRRTSRVVDVTLTYLIIRSCDHWHHTRNNGQSASARNIFVRCWIILRASLYRAEWRRYCSIFMNAFPRSARQNDGPPARQHLVMLSRCLQNFSISVYDAYLHTDVTASVVAFLVVWPHPIRTACVCRWRLAGQACRPFLTTGARLSYDCSTYDCLSSLSIVQNYTAAPLSSPGNVSLTLQRRNMDTSVGRCEDTGCIPYEMSATDTWHPVMATYL